MSKWNKNELLPSEPKEKEKTIVELLVAIAAKLDKLIELNTPAENTEG